MSIQEVQAVSAEQLAELFHNYHLVVTSPENDFSSESYRSWSEIPQERRERVIAATRLVLSHILNTQEHGNQDLGKEIRRYFAKPGEAEWGS